MTISRKNGKGNRIPAIGIQVTPKHTRKYTIWNTVKIAMYLIGTDSTNEAWTTSKTLQKIHTYIYIYCSNHIKWIRNMFETLNWFITYLYLRAGVMKRSSILSQNWFPGKLSMAMYAKYPHKTDVGIFLITGMANTDAATRSDCNRLLTLCSLTRTGKYGSISFSGSKVSLSFLPSSSFSTTAFFKFSNSFTALAC